MALKITVDTPKAGSKQIHLDGSLDSQTSSELEEFIIQAITPDVQCAILDCTNLEYISSAGIRVVLNLQKIMFKRQGHACALGLQPQVRKVFEIVQTMPPESIFSSLQELDKYLFNIQQKILDQ